MEHPNHSLYYTQSLSNTNLLLTQKIDNINLKTPDYNHELTISTKIQHITTTLTNETFPNQPKNEILETGVNNHESFTQSHKENNQYSFSRSTGSRRSARSQSFRRRSLRKSNRQGADRFGSLERSHINSNLSPKIDKVYWCGGRS